MYSPGIRSTIGGSVHPFENKDPLGKALADSVEQGAANAVQSVINWYQNASAHQEGIGAVSYTHLTLPTILLV